MAPQSTNNCAEGARLQKVAPGRKASPDLQIRTLHTGCNPADAQQRAAERRGKKKNALWVALLGCCAEAPLFSLHPKNAKLQYLNPVFFDPASSGPALERLLPEFLAGPAEDSGSSQAETCGEQPSQPGKAPQVQVISLISICKGALRESGAPEPAGPSPKEAG